MSNSSDLLGKDPPRGSERTPSGLNPRQLAAGRANMARARAARLNMPSTYAQSRYSALKHGLFVRTLDEAAQLLGEDPLELEAHRRLLEQAFLPQNETEQRVVRRIADAIWRRWRVYRAQARWELDNLKVRLSGPRSAKPLGADQTRDRAHRIMDLLIGTEPLFRCSYFLVGEVERQLRALLRLRSAGNPPFKFLTREMRREFRPDPPESREVYERLGESAPAIRKLLKRPVRVES